MPHAITLVDTLKRLLKARGITYGELASRIDMSEASVKRMFSQKNFTLQRLDEILSASGIEFDELSAAQAAPSLISQLTLAQEREIIGDPRLLVVAVSAMNQIQFDDIVQFYDMSAVEVTKYLLRLDKIGFLELLPNNRVKLLIARTFGWIPHGPIQSYFRHEAAADYLDSRFDGPDEPVSTSTKRGCLWRSATPSALLSRRGPGCRVHSRRWRAIPDSSFFARTSCPTLPIRDHT